MLKGWVLRAAHRATQACWSSQVVITSVRPAGGSIDLGCGTRRKAPASRSPCSPPRRRRSHRLAAAGWHRGGSPRPSPGARA